MGRRVCSPFPVRDFPFFGAALARRKRSPGVDYAESGGYVIESKIVLTVEEYRIKRGSIKIPAMDSKWFASTP